jgi:hypothetical protein
LIGCQEDDYITVRYEMVKVSYPRRKARKPKYAEIPRILRRPRLSDERIVEYLAEYGDIGFDKLPEWIRSALTSRSITFDKREPTEIEQWETVSDAYEHRVLNNEMTIKDFMDHYTGKRNYNHV